MNSDAKQLMIAAVTHQPHYALSAIARLPVTADYRKGGAVIRGSLLALARIAAHFDIQLTQASRSDDPRVFLCDALLARSRRHETPVSDPVALSRREEDVLVMVREHRLRQRDDADSDALRTLQRKRLIEVSDGKAYLTRDGAAVARMASAS